MLHPLLSLASSSVVLALKTIVGVVVGLGVTVAVVVVTVA